MMVSEKGRESHSDAQMGQPSYRSGTASSSGFHLYDIVCTDVDEGPDAALKEERKRKGREQAALKAEKAAEEGTILMNYLPMVSLQQA
jgi:hypothetical protein